MSFLPGTSSSQPASCVAQTPGSPQDEDVGAPMSQRIRARLQARGQRFFANDNIADCMQEGESAALVDEVEQHARKMLESLVIDLDNDHNTRGTARRLARMFVNEVFRGRYEKAPPVTEFPNVMQLNELMIVGPITVRSACSHHLCPIIGKIWIGVMPNSSTNVVGLSKYARMAEWIMNRPQIQEEAVLQLADYIQEATSPDGLALVMQASHYCMAWRGVKDKGSLMTNSVMRGSFLKNSDLRKEFLSLLPKHDPRIE